MRSFLPEKVKNPYLLDEVVDTTDNVVTTSCLASRENYTNLERARGGRRRGVSSTEEIEGSLYRVGEQAGQNLLVVS